MEWFWFLIILAGVAVIRYAYYLLLHAPYIP